MRQSNNKKQHREASTTVASRPSPKGVTARSEQQTPVYNNCVLNQTQEDFLTCKLPDGFTLSPWSFGFNILSCGPQYTNFHTDWEDPTDAFITLHGTGKKIWIFLPPGEFAALYERPTENPENLLTHLKDKSKNGHCVQLPGDTVYLPFGQFHLVVTIAESSIARFN